MSEARDIFSPPAGLVEGHSKDRVGKDVRSRVRSRRLREPSPPPSARGIRAVGRPPTDRLRGCSSAGAGGRTVSWKGVPQLCPLCSAAPASRCYKGAEVSSGSFPTRFIFFLRNRKCLEMDERKTTIGVFP